MADYTAQAIADLERLDDAAQRLEQQLARARAGYVAGLARLNAGATVADALAMGNATVIRKETTDGIEQFELARRNSRISLFRADLAEGTPLKVVASRWGVSRQLVSRAISEPHALQGVEHAPSPEPAGTERTDDGAASTALSRAR
jgi:hypothetical protein